MKHRYLPMTEQDQKEMLSSIGVEKVEELFSDIPESVRFKGEYKIKPAKSESALMKELSNLASKNADLKQYTSFLGAGVYDHYHRLLWIMSFHVRNFIQPIRHINRKFLKGNYKLFLNFKR